MSFDNKDTTAAEEIHIPADIDWQMLDKSKFFILGAALFSAVSAALYPMLVLKTRQQVHLTQSSTFRISSAILKQEGFKGFYRGFGISLMGTIPARAVYMTALEVTKSGIGSESCKLGFSSATSIAIANAAGGLSSALAAQLVWTPVDVVSQRLMVQSEVKNPIFGKFGCCKYSNGIDAFRKIVSVDGVKGLYRGFGVSMLAYAPSNALWWGSYSLANRLIWESQIGNNNNFKIRHFENHDFDDNNNDWKKTVVFQGLSATMASGVSALITMPLDTIKTRVQVLDHGFGRRTIADTVRDLVREGGFSACYRGLGPRWASMSMSATTMITTYELLKRLSAKNQEIA